MPAVVAAALAAGTTDELALSAAAAILYSRPDLISPALVDGLYACAEGSRLTAERANALQRLLGYLPVTPHAPLGWSKLVDTLPRAELAAVGRGALIRVVRDYVQWRPDLVHLATVLELAALPALVDHRAFLLDYVVEPLVYGVPETFDGGATGRLKDLFAGAPRLRYVLDALVGRPRTPPAVKAHLEPALATQFPLRPVAAAILRERPLSVLAVLNVDVGQGDELVRLVPLLQALLDANAAVRVTVISPRPYLYDDPRVQAVQIGHAEHVDRTLQQRWDVIIDIEEPELADVSLRPALAARMEALALGNPPGLLVRGNVGWNHFTYHTAELAGQELARRFALDRVSVDSIYETCLRLLAELGLPARAGTEDPRTPSLLTAEPSRDAAAAWFRLIGRPDGTPGRPVVLVQPFGGRARVKGFVERQAPALAAELTGLVLERYQVVLLPSGTPWVTPAVLADVQARLPAGVRPWVAVAPDPAEPDPARQVFLRERPDLPYADRVMRLFKYFATYADLVCTVEGWMAHLAYNLGRPFRLMLKAQSYWFEWHPHGRSMDQRLVLQLSPLGPPQEEEDLLGHGRPPPLPHRPRKGLLELALPGLDSAGDPRAVPLLFQAAASDDWDVRAAAVAALGRLRPLDPLKQYLLAALGDPEPLVSLKAAEALLAAGVDCRRELGPRDSDVLGAYRDIARQRWQAVLDLGPVALPAIAVAMRSDNDVIRREARLASRLLLSRWAHVRGQTRAGSPDPSRLPAGLQ